MEILLIIIVLILFFYYKKKKKKKRHNPISVTTTFSKSIIKSDKDSFEGWFYDEVEIYIDIKKEFEIKYKDANSNITSRKIFINKFGKASFGGFILAYCFLREENRTFRTDRILECINCETGEYIEDISKYLEEIYLNSDAYKELQELQKKREEKEISSQYIDEFISKHNNLLKILIYIVKCDGSFNAKEKAIVKELLEGLDKDSEILNDNILNKILLKIPIITERAFKLCINKFIKEAQYANIDLTEITNNIISTQNNIHHNEQEVIRYIEEKIKDTKKPTE